MHLICDRSKPKDKPERDDERDADDWEGEAPAVRSRMSKPPPKKEVCVGNKHVSLSLLVLRGT